MTPLGWVINPLLQRSLEMRETFCRTPKLHVLADIVASLFAAVAGIARHADFQGNAIADGEVGDGRADSGDDAGGLVAQGQGLADEDVAVAVVGVVVEVAAAEAGAVNCYLDFGCRGGGQVAGFLGLVSILFCV